MNTIIVTLDDNEGELLRYDSEFIPRPRDFLEYESNEGETLKLQVLAVCICVREFESSLSPKPIIVTSQSHIKILVKLV